MDDFIGIKKKVSAQVAAFNLLNLNCTLYICKSKPGRLGKVIRRLPYLNSFENWIDHVSINDLDFLYIRKPIIDHQFISNLKIVKKIKTDIKIFLEIPTYPYDKELNRLIDIPLLLKEKQNREKIKKLVDKIVTYSDDDEIFGVKTIKIANGVDLNSLQVKKTKYKQDYITLLGVANISKWHGYDRVIEGLNKFYEQKNYKQKNYKQKVKFTIVGEGSELPKLKKMVNDYNLDEYVKFKGFLDGKELDNEFNNADIGIVSLGIHRIGLERVSTLKSKEYWARGLPLVKSYKDFEIDNTISDYVLNVPPNESPININTIINFYNKLNSSDNNYHTVMRELAEGKISWDTQMLPIIDEIKKDKSEVSKILF